MTLCGPHLPDIWGSTVVRQSTPPLWHNYYRSVHISHKEDQPESSAGTTSIVGEKKACSFLWDGSLSERHLEKTSLIQQWLRATVGRAPLIVFNKNYPSLPVTRDLCVLSTPCMVHLTIMSVLLLRSGADLHCLQMPPHSLLRYSLLFYFATGSFIHLSFFLAKSVGTQRNWFCLCI